MSQPLRIGIAGLGSVGASVARLLRDNASILERAAGRPIILHSVSARDRSKDRGIDLAGVTWHEDATALASDAAVDVVVELIGGAEGRAFDLVTAAIRNGKPVVTGNKAMLSQRAAELAPLLDQHKGSIAFEAAVAGGIPAIKSLREGLAANKIQSLAGILNGTCNFILSTMDVTGRAFADVLQEAQQLGYAEAEPSFDIDGIDTAHKLSILAALAFGGMPDIGRINVQGIRDITLADIRAAKEFGFAIKLLGIATESIRKVAPVLVPLHSPVAGVNGPLNTVSIRGDYAGAVTLTGAGAGGAATASAVVADIVDIARGFYLPFFSAEPAGQSSHDIAPPPARFYLRAGMNAEKAFAEIEARGILLPQKHSGMGAALTEMVTLEKLSSCLSGISMPVFHLQIEENL